MKKKSIILTAIAFLLTLTLQAQEQQANEQSSSIKRVSNRRYTPDPAPVVSGDRLYVFTGHDLDTATYFRMPDWQVFSTTDMEHWTDHGIVLTTAHFKWAKQGDNAWASQAIKDLGLMHLESRSSLAAGASSTPQCSSTTTGKLGSSGATTVAGMPS